MSNGMEAEVEVVTTTEDDQDGDIANEGGGDEVPPEEGGTGGSSRVTTEAEVLQESHEEEGVEGKSQVINCIQIDISERSRFLQVEDGEGSGQSSATTTPLERSEEVIPTSRGEGEAQPTKDLLLLKEWNSFINLLARIPVSAQKGFRTFDLKLTCISTISDEILVIGTNVGIVYWYNRRTDVLDRLRCEGIEVVTCLNCISTVDYMVAAGTQAGLVTIFQIPKDPSQVRNASNSNLTYERKTKKSQQFLIQDLHKGAITALEWSRNGMKLFSGDQSGHVVLTDIDYDLVQIRSSVLHCENYEIVQLSYARKSLLICSTFRSVIYSLENKDLSKVGSLERKIMGKFGGLIVSSAWEESPKVYSVRPGGRLWVANLSGIVQHTIKFKELILSESQPEIHVIKPLRNHQLQQDIQFTRLFRFMKDYLVTSYKDILHVVDARNTIVLGTCKELRSVLDVAVNKDEIFILESSRNVIRLSAKPDKFASLNFSNILNASSSYLSPPRTSSTSSAFHQQQVNSDSPTSAAEFSVGLKNLPDIMSASISDFRFPQEPINFLTSKFKETSDKVIPRINPILNTIKTVIEADVDIEDGQKLLEGGLPPPITALETGEIPALEIFMPPEEPVFVPEPERFQKISNLPFEDVVVEAKQPRKGKRSARSKTLNGTAKEIALSDVASDTVSVSSSYSNTSGSDNNATVGVRIGTKIDGNTSSTSAASTSSSARKLSDTTLSSSNSGSEAMSMSEHSHLLKDQLGVPLALSQSWSVGTLVPNKTVTKEELHLKEELLARRLKWPELLPESASSDILFDELVDSTGTIVDSPQDNTQSWQVNVHRYEKISDRTSVLTLVGPKHSTDETTDTDSRTLSMENSSFTTVIEREAFLKEIRNADISSGPKNVSENSSEADDEEDKYYMDIYNRYRSKDSISSYSSVLSFGPPSGSSYISNGTGAFGGSLNANISNSIPANDSSSTRDVTPSSSGTIRLPNSTVEEELTNSKEKSGDAETSSSSTTEEMDSIVESKIVTEEYWRKWKLPAPISQISVCDHYIICVSYKGIVYYANFDAVTLHWKSTSYNASAMTVSPCGSVVWRIFKGDLYSLTNCSTSETPIPVGVGGEQWSKLTQKKDVLAATVQRSFGWIVKLDGSLEFCTGLLETRLIPYFEKIYTPWPIQEVACCGHRLWALTSDGRIVFRTGTSDLNPKGIDWLEIKWGSNDDIPPACSISCGELREDEDVPSVWFSDANGNLYFTFDERDSKGLWIPWKVSGSNSIIQRNEPNCSSKVLLSSIREHVSKSFKSLVQQGTKADLKICSSRHSVWFTGTESSIIYGNRSTITGHYWKPLRVDRGITVPSTWTNIYANSIYKGHGYLWIADSKGYLMYLPHTGGKLQRVDLPVVTEGQILNIAPAPEALWALTSTGDIHGRCDITTTDPVGKTWRQINLSTLKPTQFVHISCGSEVAWAVDEGGEVYMRTGSLRPPGTQDMSPAWNKVESATCCRGVFTKVYVGGNDSIVWALDNKKRIFARQAVFPDYPIGTGWLLVKGVDATMLSISDTAVWALSSNGDIYRRHGITKTNFVGDYWRKIPGNASAITVSLCDELWALSPEGYLLKHSRKIMTLKGWSSRAGNEVGNRGAPATKIVLDEEDEDWELVDNSEI